MWELIQSNKRKSVALIILLAFVLLALGYAMGISMSSDAGPVGVVIALIVWVVMVFASVVGGEKILLASAGARRLRKEDAPQLWNTIEEMQIASGLPVMPEVYLIDQSAPNAFAVGLTPKRAAVAVTTGLLARLNRDELQGVVAHEIGHIANRDTLFMTLAGVTVGAIILLSEVFLRGMRFAGRSRRSSKRSGQGQALMALLALLLAILAPIVAQLLYFACSRRREYLADASAAQFTRYPAGLASALEKISAMTPEQIEVSRALAPMYIVNPLKGARRAARWHSTHPPTADRIRILRGMGGSSFAAYEAAFRGAHNNQGVLRPGELKGSVEKGVRAAVDTPDEGLTAAQSRRAAQNVIHRMDGVRMLTCDCGLKIKVPADFDSDTIACPRCGTRHRLSAAATMPPVPPPLP